MKRRLVVLFCVLAAGGCSRWVDVDSSAFSSGFAPTEQFQQDDKACVSKAEIARSYGIYGVTADNVGKRRIYNQTYTACMQAKGYKEHESSFEFPDSFDFF
jgi:hypothetical protein